MATLWTVASVGFSAAPGYAIEALRQFSTQTPAGWSYALTTARNNEVMVEQFDPQRGHGKEWQLRECFGRTPTSDELAKYARSRPNAGSGGPQANFDRADIEPGSLRLVSEDSDKAVFDAEFRSVASGPDKMLGHLQLQLSIRKSPAFVESTRLTLKEPYWPVLGVKMTELQVDSTYSPPSAGSPSLPIGVRSRFSGHILLFPKQEILQIDYTDFQKTR